MLCCAPYPAAGNSNNQTTVAYGCQQCKYNMCVKCTAAQHQERERQFYLHQFCPQCRADRSKFTPLTAKDRAALLASNGALVATCGVCTQQMPLADYAVHRLGCYLVGCRSPKCSFIGNTDQVQQHENGCRKVCFWFSYLFFVVFSSNYCTRTVSPRCIAQYARYV